MIHETTVLDAFMERDVVALDGTRYYSPEGAKRVYARGQLSYWSVNEASAEIRLIRHDGIVQEVDPFMTVFGANDVWFTKPMKMQRPNPLAPLATVREMNVLDWYHLFAHGTVVFDMHFILHARGAEGGGRGRTERPPMITRVQVQGSPEHGFPDIDSIVVQSTNRRLEVLPDGRIADRGAMLQKTLQSSGTIWLAGKSFVFSDYDDARMASSYGLIGDMPVKTKTLDKKTTAFIEDSLREFGEEYFRKHVEDVTHIFEGRGRS